MGVLSRRARPVPAPDGAREHRLLRRAARHGARRRRTRAPRRWRRMLEMTRAARPPHRRLQPGRAHEDGAGPRAWCTTRPTSCSTSRPTASTCSPRAPCATRCAGCATPAGGAKCIVFRPTSCRRSSACATASSSSRTAAPSPAWQRSRRCSRRPASATSRRRSSSWRSSASAPAKGARRAGAASAPSGSSCKKELSDALARPADAGYGAGVVGVLMGPAGAAWPSAWSLSARDARRASARSTCAGLAHAPTLRNYLERQTYTVKAAPADYEAQPAAPRHSPIRWSSFRADFPEADAGARRRAGGRDRVRQRQPARRGEHGPDRSDCCGGSTVASGPVLSLALRGVSLQAARGRSQIRGSRPGQHADRGRPQHHRHAAAIFVLMAVALRRAQRRALDTTAGEARARLAGAPLLMRPGCALALWSWASGARWRASSMLIARAERASASCPAQMGTAQRHAGGDVPVWAGARRCCSCRAAAAPRRRSRRC